MDSVKPKQENISIPRPLSCGENCALTCCPCALFSDPGRTLRDCCLCTHELGHATSSLSIPPLVQIGGTYASSVTPTPNWFVALRVICAVLMLYCLVFNFSMYVVKDKHEFWLIYYTVWANLLAVVLMLTKCVSTYRAYRYFGKEALSAKSIWSQLAKQNTSWKLYLTQHVMLAMTVPNIALVSFNYWVGAYSGFSSVFTAISSLNVHVVSVAIVWLDFLLSAERLYYKSFLWPLALWIVYAIWVGVFHAAGFENEHGNEFIYEGFGWHQPMNFITIFVLSCLLLTAFSMFAAFLKNLVFIFIAPKKFTANEFSNSNDDDDQEAHDHLMHDI